MRRSLALLLLALAAAFPASADAAHKRTVPRGFAGVVAEAALFKDPDIDSAGLRTIGPGGPEPKPAFAAFRRVALKLEGCRRKGSTAAACRR
jgi:hypothetical protein